MVCHGFYVSIRENFHARRQSSRSLEFVFIPLRFSHRRHVNALDLVSVVQKLNAQGGLKLMSVEI